MKPDARGWIGIGVFALVLVLLYIIAEYPELREDDFFQAIATLIIGTAFVNGVVAWAYTATKQGGEMADRNMAVVEQVAQTTANTAAAATIGPQEVKVVNPPEDPANVTETAPADESLPDYAR